jgi:hypothetical protein
MHKCNVCQKEFESGSKLGGHKTGHLKDFDKILSEKARKRFLIQERGHGCEICSYATWCNKPIPIELDHIDGNADNNVRENLRLICPNCHAQTDTYKSKNKACESRRKRYIRNLSNMPS